MKNQIYTEFELQINIDVEVNKLEVYEPNRMGHTTRFSDSSLYDEICIHCGATDGRDQGLKYPCPGKR